MADESQALAGLRVMVAVAKADGHLADQERQQIEEALRELAPNLSIDQVLAEDVDLDAEIAKITDPEVRKATYRAAAMLSVVDGESHEAESALLRRIRQAYGLSDEGTGVAKVLEEANQLAPIDADKDTRVKETKSEVLGHAMMAAALGANPLPVISLFTEIAVFYMQGRLVRNLAWYYGYDVTGKHAAALLGSTFGLGMARSVIMQFVKLVPVWGSVVGGATAFTTTYALGETVRRHFESGGDLVTLSKREAKKAYEEIKKTSATAEYEKAKPEIEKKAKEKQPELEAIARDASEGKLADDQIAERIKDIS